MANDVGQGRPAAETIGIVEASAKLARALASGDAAGLDALKHPDFTVVDLSGQVRRPPAMVAAVDHGADAAATGRIVQIFGSVAMVTARTPMPGQGEIVALDVWVRSGGEWRALIRHLNRIAEPGSPSTHPEPIPRPADAGPPDCANPCEFVPYDARTDSERDIIATFQALETAVINNDADEWVRHMADEFIVYRTKQHPTTRAQRAGHLRNQRGVNAETFVAAVEAMTLWVFGDAAVMRADHVMPGNRRPPYRATRVWVKRDGRWQMTVSQQTTRVD